MHKIIDGVLRLFTNTATADNNFCTIYLPSPNEDLPLSYYFKSLRHEIR